MKKCTHQAFKDMSGTYFDIGLAQCYQHAPFGSTKVTVVVTENPNGKYFACWNGHDGFIFIRPDAHETEELRDRTNLKWQKIEKVSVREIS